MSGINRDQRSMGWNITFYLGDTAFAGIFQAKECLAISDVARDLDLCFVFPWPLGDWEATLLPRHDVSEHILLDESNTAPFPGPDVAGHYTYLLHSRSRCHVAPGAHTRRSPCYQQAPLPTRRRDERYATIGKQSETGGKSFMMPLRQARGTKRSASGSRSRGHSGSASSTPSEADNEEIPVSVISPDVARAKISTFRSNVLSSGNTVCAISGKGKSWIGGLIGTGIEAAHIIPQIHWAVYPLGDLDLRDVAEQAQREIAWRRTWMPANGLPMLSHLHRNYEARLVTIHPRTLKIRSFVDYDILLEFHGQQAHLPSAYTVDTNALQQQYDMCCIENMVASWIPDEPSPAEGPGRQVLLMAPPQVLSTSSTAAGDTAADSSGGPTNASLTGPPSLQPSTSASGFTTHPPSPPSSDSGGRRRRWLCGSEVVEDPQEAQDLRQQGWILQEVDSEEQQRLQSKRRWIWGEHVIDDPNEAKELREQGWSLQEVRVGSKEEYRLLAAMDRSIWNCPDSEIIDDPEIAADLLSAGYALHKVQKHRVAEIRTSDIDRGRPRKRRLTLDDAEEEHGHTSKNRRLSMADLSPDSSFM